MPTTWIGAVAPGTDGFFLASCGVFFGLQVFVAAMIIATVGADGIPLTLVGPLAMVFVGRTEVQRTLADLRTRRLVGETPVGEPR
jgi:uncharacterized membrane protein (UPF0136 family)